MSIDSVNIYSATCLRGEETQLTLLNMDAKILLGVSLFTCIFVVLTSSCPHYWHEYRGMCYRLYGT
jgi:hypothetical protein